MTNKKKRSSSSFIGSRLTSIVTNSLVLFLVGVLVALTFFSRELTSYVKENIGFSVILTDKATDADLKAVERQLQSARYVKSMDVFTKQRALKELAEELGENPRKFLGSVPLMASVDVKLKSEYANNDSISLIESELKANESIREILYRKDLIQTVNDNVNSIGLVLLAVASLFAMISFVVMGNTIRLHIYSQRFALQTMKLVGASNGFIRRPFIVSNIYNGVMASSLAIGLLSATFYLLSNQIPSFALLVTPESLLVTFGSVLISGVLLSILFTYISLNRFLRMKREKLYTI